MHYLCRRRGRWYGSHRDLAAPAPRRGGRVVPDRHRARHRPAPPGKRASAARAEPQWHLTNGGAEAGIAILHHVPTLDSTLDNVAPLLGAPGASVSITDVNNDGWPDLYLTNGCFGYDASRLRTTRIIENSFEFATNRGKHHLGLRPVRCETSSDVPNWSLTDLAAQYPHNHPRP